MWQAAGAANTLQMPSPVNLSTVPSKRCCTPSERIWKKAVHDPVQFFGVDLLGEVHRALHIGEQHSHLLTFAFEGAPGGEDLLREMFRRVGTRVGGAGRGCAGDRERTLVTELGYGPKLCTAACTLASE
jgi:hypothetical protein